MIEELQITVYPRQDANARFAAWLALREAPGFRVDRERWAKLHDAVDVYVSPSDQAVFRVFDDAKAKGLIERWDRVHIFQRYSPSEFAASPLFAVVHVGRCVEVPKGTDNIAAISHFVDFDVVPACSNCGAGATQTGAMRIPGAELNKAGRFASIMIGNNEFLMASETVVDALAAAAGGVTLPLRRVESIGRTKAKEQWFQFFPLDELPIAACHEGRWVRQICPKCEAVRLTSPGDDLAVGGYFMVSKELLGGTRLVPPIVRAPYWYGDVERFDDARLITVPDRRIWLRGDVGRALAAMKIRGLDMVPVLLN